MRLKRCVRSGGLVAGLPFQYQKGAIKTDLRERTSLSVREHSFNTKKVRLKPRGRAYSRKAHRRPFQYQKGAIKTRDSEARRQDCLDFQYQKGAIKTNVLRSILDQFLYFQYQKGAIKTRCPLVRTRAGIRTFNTKKVRLKPSDRSVVFTADNLLSIPKRCD